MISLKAIMLLAQINQAADFQHDGEAQEVTLCLTEAVGVSGQTCIHDQIQHERERCAYFIYSLDVHFSDGDQSTDTVSLQAVTLADGSTAYIPHDPRGNIDTVLSKEKK